MTTSTTSNLDCAFHCPDDTLKVQRWLDACEPVISGLRLRISTKLVFKFATQFRNCQLFVAPQLTAKGSWFCYVGVNPAPIPFVDTDIWFGSTLYHYDAKGHPTFVKTIT
jgi:hypothetical protein